MTYKIILWMAVFMLNIQLALAQTGLFVSSTATDFAVTGIVLVVIILVFKEVFNRMFKKNDRK